MKIATHNGVFHADEVFAVAALSLLLPDFNFATDVVRTRVQALIDQADVVIDVGGVYDAEAGRFDHHQSGGAGARWNGIPYASFGLVWKKYGAEIAGSEAVAEEVDYQLVQAIDAHDCGVELLTERLAAPVVSVSWVVSGFNPLWTDENPQFDLGFQAAVGFAQSVLRHTIAAAAADSLAVDLVAKAVSHSNKVIVELERFCPWQEPLATMCPSAVYVLFPDVSGTWRVRAVSVAPDSMTCKKPLPEAWRGLCGDALDAVAGIPGTIFCHPNGFIAGHLTKEWARALAEVALAS